MAVTRRWLVTLVLVVAAAATAWVVRPHVIHASTASQGTSSSESGTVVLPRPAGTPVIAPPIKDGNLLLRPLSSACGQSAVFGTHAELNAVGSFCAVSVEVVNASGEAHTFSLQAQELVLADGRRLHVDPSAMGVRRQPDEQELAGRERVWLELWFDVPLGSDAHSVALHGDSDPPAFRASAPASRAPNGVAFDLPPSR